MKTSKVTPQKLHPQLQKLDNKLRQAAKLYEKQFLRQMVKSMRNSVSHSAMTKPGMAERIYREQLDDQYVENWSDRGGTGFADMVYKELVNKFYPQLGQRRIKKVRPANITDRFQGVTRSHKGKAEKSHSFQLKLSPQEAKQSYLSIPWDAKFKQAFQLEGGQQAAKFEHEDGVTSTFVFRGKIQPRLLDKELKAGENFAVLSPESQEMTWQIGVDDSRKDPSTAENSAFR